MSKASSVDPIFIGDLNPFHFGEIPQIFYMAKGSLKRRRICVCGEFLSLSQRASAIGRENPPLLRSRASIVSSFNGGLSDSSNTGRRWVFKKLARFGPRVGSFNSLSVFLARSWTHEYSPPPSPSFPHSLSLSLPHAQISPTFVSSLVCSPTLGASTCVQNASPKWVTISLSLSLSLFYSYFYSFCSFVN